MTSVYFDASVIVPLFVVDAFSERADAFIRRTKPTAVISDFAAAEFASAVARRVRMSLLPAAMAQLAFAQFDQWFDRAEATAITSADLVIATGWLRLPELHLRTPDAINLAVAWRSGLTLATFDDRLSQAARHVGVELARV